MITAPTTLRAIQTQDIAPLMRQLEQWHRVQWRISPHEIADKLRGQLALMAEDPVGARGFMLIEPHSAGYGLISGVGMRDGWGVQPYFHHLLPPLIELARTQPLSGLMGLGNEDWFVNGLKEHGFIVQEWILALERVGVMPALRARHVAVLRPAYPRDLATLLRLDEATFDPMWQVNRYELQHGLQKPKTVWLAEFNGVAVGYAWFEGSEAHAHFTRLVVQPRYQGRGIGAQLVEQVINQAIAQGATLITVNTLAQNQRSLALYERFGFRHTRERMPVLWREL